MDVTIVDLSRLTDQNDRRRILLEAKENIRSRANRHNENVPSDTHIDQDAAQRTRLIVKSLHHSSRQRSHRSKPDDR